MQMLRQIATHDAGSFRMTTAEIKSVDGTPLFSSVFFEGTPASAYGAPFRNTLYASEAEAVAGHAAIVERLSAGWKMPKV